VGYITTSLCERTVIRCNETEFYQLKDRTISRGEENDRTVRKRIELSVTVRKRI
jgi:hypothetical protein